MTTKSILIVSVCVLLVLAIGLIVFRGHSNHPGDQVFRDRALNVVQSLKAGDYQNAKRDFMREGMTSEELRKWWETTTDGHGPLKDYSIAYAGPIENDPNDIYGVCITCKFDKDTKWMVIRFFRSWRINGLGFRDRPTKRFSLGDTARRPSSMNRTYEQMALDVVRSLRAGDYRTAERDFRSGLKRQLSPNRLGQAWSQAIARYGPLKEYSITQIGPERDPNNYGVCITCKFERQAAWMVLKFDGSKQIYKFGIYETPQQAARTNR